MTVKFTLIRHGESMDNLRSVWAGSLDSTLSNHGMNQANALARSLSITHFDAIYTSDLKRASITADALLSSQPTPHPTILPTQLLREQHFGMGEGKPYFVSKDPNITSLSAHYAQGKFPAIYDRNGSFPLGESLRDVQGRAEKVIEELLMPFVWKAEGRVGEEEMRKEDVNVAIVSHGIFISELVQALVRMGSGSDADGLGARQYKGMRNTAWARVDVSLEEEKRNGNQTASDKPRFVVKVTSFNRHEHLDDLKRQRGGIGSLPFNPEQKDIRAFFGDGAGKIKKENKIKAKMKPY